MNSQRTGMVLVSVLIVTVLAAMVAAGLLFRVQAEISSSTASSNGEQAHAAALSGIQTAITLMTTPPEDLDEPSEYAALGDPTLWHDNPDLFRNRLVYDDGANEWYFTIYSQNLNDEESVRYGLSDESGKVNINTAPRDVLLELPGMTSELVDTLIDYRDENEEAEPEGAEQDYYDTLPTPYMIKNGALASIEELLLVKGFNGSIVYGEDANFNGLLEPNENDGDEKFPPDDNDGVLSTGLKGNATAISYAADLDQEGKQRVSINTARQNQLREIGLSDETVEFINVYRGEGNQFVHPSQLLNMSYQMKQRAPRRGGGSSGPLTLQSGVGAEELPLVMDKLTTNQFGGRVPLIGVINVNAATADVLAALPGISRNTAEQIVEARVNLEVETLATTAWIYTEGLVSASQYKEAAPYLTNRGYQYRLRCVGFGVPCGRYRILEAVIDFAPSQQASGPRVIYLRDITRLGLPFALSVEDEEL